MTKVTRPQTEPTLPNQQPDRGYDPDEIADLDRRAAGIAMESHHQAFTGSAHGVGSVGFNELGAYAIGPATDSQENIMSDTPTPSERPSQTQQAEGPSTGALETGVEQRTYAEIQDRDPGEAAGTLTPEAAEIADQTIAADDAGQSAFAQDVGNEQSDARRQHAEAQSSIDGDGVEGPDQTRATDDRTIDQQGL